ncbi:HD-GYP domain-containing protein [Balneatrix alpica]|uniref:HD-GYP domain-containing protein n=1 Tax=Balneatrix alpica TaxID=75684 RepID=A0ABV5ZCX1_9GAMM|nr:HD-GYP domain-containing protein [Balneatrix alpica]
MHSVKLSELVAALSFALDITEGQPKGHCLRCCWLGMHLAEGLGLSASQRHDLYYTLLLKDLGCSSNAARICELYGTDDLNFKRSYKRVDGSLPQVLEFVRRHTGLTRSTLARLLNVMRVLRHGSQWSQELIQTRCERGATIARRMRFSEAVAQGIHALDEHWNGEGKPDRLAGEAIPLYARIALLTQVVDVFVQSAGKEAALAEVKQRSGSWFDPHLVAQLLKLEANTSLWRLMQADVGELEQALARLAPPTVDLPLDDDYLDEIAMAFGQVVDAKSPYTAGHSERVAFYTEQIAAQLGLAETRRRWLKRAALLHDLGKLGVSNVVLDKPGKLDADEWQAVQQHAAYTGQILGHIDAFQDLAAVAAAHHERLDGKGYPLGLEAEQISLETRIITTADIFDAITADRPYRAAIPIPRALEMMREHLHTAIDPQCFAALEASIAQQANPLATA